MIKISVIIPVYNREKYIEECLNSVLSQSLKEIEVICIDDGSTDCSYKILLDYSKKYRNVIVIHQENQGVSVSRNRGLEYARGKYVCFMDSDDYYAQDCALEQLYINAEENKALVCGGNLFSIWEDGKIQKASKWFFENKMVQFQEYANLYNYTNFIFDLKMIRENNIRFPHYRIFEDPPFFLKIMENVSEFFAINELVYVYREGYKEVKYSFNMALDLLKGIHDCFLIAMKNNFLKTYDEYLKNILRDYLYVIYQYLDCDQIWELINKINKISEEWMGECQRDFHDRESLEAYIGMIKIKQDQLILECQKAEKVVIYGAGEVGRFFLCNYGDECRHIEGFAVSKKNNNDLVEGYEVREIGEYDKEVLVIVAVGKKHMAEILENLERMKFKKIYCMNYTELRLLQKL